MSITMGLLLSTLYSFNTSTNKNVKRQHFPSLHTCWCDSRNRASTLTSSHTAPYEEWRFWEFPPVWGHFLQIKSQYAVYSWRTSGATQVTNIAYMTYNNLNDFQMLQQDGKHVELCITAYQKLSTNLGKCRWRM